MYGIMTNDPVKCPLSDPLNDSMNLLVNEFIINNFGAKCNKISISLSHTQVHKVLC